MLRSRLEPPDCKSKQQKAERRVSQRQQRVSNNSNYAGQDDLWGDAATRTTTQSCCTSVLTLSLPAPLLAWPSASCSTLTMARWICKHTAKHTRQVRCWAPVVVRTKPTQQQHTCQPAAWSARAVVASVVHQTQQTYLFPLLQALWPDLVLLCGNLALPAPRRQPLQLLERHIGEVDVQADVLKYAVLGEGARCTLHCYCVVNLLGVAGWTPLGQQLTPYAKCVANTSTCWACSLKIIATWAFSNG